MTASIPASAIVNVVPNVITAGGSALDLVGTILTTNTQLPIGVVMPFSNAADVSTYFGPLSTEYALAQVYFGGYDGATITPARLNFTRYATSAVAAYLRGGSVASMTLTQLQALTGVLTLTINGTSKTSGTINLSSATSFSNAASIIQAAFTSPGFTVSYDSLSGGFVFTSSTTGASSTITFTTGTLSSGLKLTAATGAVTSQGSDIMVPATAMDAIVALTQNWVSFMTTFEPSDSNKLAFAAWANGKDDRYLYVAWDSNSAATATGDTSSFGYLVRAAGYSGTAPIYDAANGATIAAFVLGAIASLNFDQTNGRATLAFRKSSLITAGVTSQSVGDALIANGYNFVGSYATADASFTLFYPGQVSGQFLWIDSWAGQVWMNNAFQLALMTLLTSVGQVPYNTDGKALISASLRDTINAALNFGAIRAGVPLSNQQKAEINALVGGNAADTVEQVGWFVQVGDASAAVRAARGSPPINVIYTDGQSVQKITLNSVAVQ